MELHELHVLEGHARAVGQRHAVAGADGAVGGEGVDAAVAAGGQDHRAGGQGTHLTRAHVEADDALTTAVLGDQRGDEKLVQALDVGELQRGLEDRVQHVKARLVGGEAGAPGGHAAEGPHADTAVRFPAPGAAPVLHLDHLERRLPHEHLDHVLVGQVVAALDGVEGVPVEAVGLPKHGRAAALGGDRVAAHGIDLGDHRHAQFGVGLGGRDGRPDARQPTPHDQDVVGRDLNGHGPRC